jgi:hypothetical protein
MEAESWIRTRTSLVDVFAVMIGEGVNEGDKAERSAATKANPATKNI